MLSDEQRAEKKRWDEILKRNEVEKLATNLVRLANLKLHGRYAEYVIPQYAFSEEQWESDRRRVIEAAQCVIQAIGPGNCRAIESIASRRYGLHISAELAKVNPYAAAPYIIHWGFLSRVSYYSEPPWCEKVRACGGGQAASRILGFSKPRACDET